MSLYYTITEDMWWNHALTLPFQKPYQGFTPHQQAMQYFDGLRDIRKPSAFADVHQEISEMAPAAITPPSVNDMPLIEDAEPPEGGVTPDPDTYEPTGNKFTRLHSPGTEEDDSDDPHASCQGTPDCSQQDTKKQIKEDNPLTPDIHPRTPNLITAQLDREQHESDKVPAQLQAQQTAPFPAGTAKVEPTNAMVDPLQVLPAMVPVALGSTTVTEEEDQLLGVSDVTATEIAVRLPPDQMKDTSSDDTPDEKDDVKLTSKDVGDNMEDI